MGLETAALVAVAGGGLMQASSTISGGNTAKKNAKIQAAQLQSQANSVQGDSQRDAQQQRLQERLTQSALIARVAAGGGDVSSAGVANLAGGIAAQGDYNALTALYNGNVKATGLRNQAAMTLYEGDLAKKASRTQALAGLLQTGGSLASMGAKYGGAGSAASATGPGAISAGNGWFSTQAGADAASSRAGITWAKTGGYR